MTHDVLPWVAVIFGLAFVLSQNRIAAWIDRRWGG